MPRRWRNCRFRARARGFSVGDRLHTCTPRSCRSRTASTLRAPAYLMGVGTPEDLLAGDGAGIDLFDCVMPTRNARNGQAFTWQASSLSRTRANRADPLPLDRSAAARLVGWL